MLNPIYLFLPMILFLGIITTYEDIKTGKIRNKWIVIALIYAILFNLGLIIYMSVTGQEMRIAYFYELGISFIISLAAGFLMWTLGLWTAGDAKLFAAFSLLIPLTVYRWGHIPYFSSANILINTFVPFFLIYSAIMLYKTTWKQKLHYLLQAVKPKQVASTALFLFAFMWPLAILFNRIGFQQNYFTGIIALFAIMVILEKILPGQLKYILAGVSILRLLLDPTLLSVNTWILFLLTLVGFLFLRMFILHMGYDYMTQIIDVNLLKPGMVPAQSVYKEKGKFRRQNILHFSMLSYMHEGVKKRDYLFEPSAEGLTKADVKKLHKLKLGFEHLKVYKTLNFAPYMFAGVILTIIFQGSLFIAIFS